MNFLRLILLGFILISCGDDSPFDEDYWESSADSDDQEETFNEGRFVATLAPVSGLSFTDGAVDLQVDGNSASLTVRMEGIPSNIIQANVTVIETPCESIVSNPPTTGTLENRNFTYTENGTRAALFRDLGPGENIEGQSIVINAYSIGTTTTTTSGIFPLACGPLLRPSSLTGGNAVAGTNTTGTTGVTGVTGFNGSTVGGVTGVTGVTGTTVGGTTGLNTTGGVTVGTVSGVNAGTNVGGVTVGTVSGVASGTVGGTTGF